MSITETSPPFVLQWLDPATLEPNEQNWRLHPTVQADALAESLAAVGWAGAALYNRTTGRLIDGHLRREAAIARGEQLPALVGDWTPEQERLILVTLDPIAGLAAPDLSRLEALQEQIRQDLDAGVLSFDPEALAGLLGAAPDPSGPQVPEVAPQAEPQLASEVYIEIYCSAANLALFEGTLQRWGAEEGVTVNIS